MIPDAEHALTDLLAAHGVADTPTRLRLRLQLQDIGRSAGRVRGDVLTINTQLVDHPDEVFNTLAHELAHVVVDTARKRLRIRRRRGAWSPHGSAWKSVARRLGDAGDRCHRLPLRPLRTVSRYLYRLPDGTERVLSAIRHNRLQRNHSRGYHFRGDPEPVRGRHFVAELEAKPSVNVEA